jgi:2-dehydro-3-deoxygalactonokinase
MDGATVAVDWIALDWGTTNLRGWAMSDSGAILAQAMSENGMGKLSRDGYEPALLDLIGGWSSGPMTAVACGMVGSRQGWVEAPYAHTPCSPTPANFVVAPTTTPGLTVHVIPGIRQDDPADVMRGEETQIAGFLALNPGWDGVMCLPGTHTKWVHVSAGEVVSFQTVMTGELFAMIGTQTVLRHTVAAIGWDESAFLTALDASIARPERLAGRLFSLRAEHLLHGLEGAAARSRLSGLLIGAELAATKPYWLGQKIAVIGAGTVSKLYVQALATQSAPATIADGQAVTLAGLTAAYRSLKGA